QWNGDYQAALCAELLTRAQSLGAAEGLDPAAPFAGQCELWLQSDRGRLLLILDQFEEFFLYQPEPEQLSFARLLSSLMDRGVRLLLSLREDKLSLLERLRPALPDVFANQLRVDHMDEQSAREAIEEPVKKWNEINQTTFTIEPALTDNLVAEFQPEQMKVRAAAIGIGS